MMDLVLDIGNSRTKVALFVNGSGQKARISRSGVMANTVAADISSFVADDRVARIAVGSVAREDPAFLRALEEIAPVTVLTGESPSGLRNTYSSPRSLGVDRLANALAATILFPGRAVLAIDPGTCVTYDLVDAGGTYLGGIISPGLRMRARAMHEQSARLPEVEPGMDIPLLGTSTEECLAAGAHHGLRAELKALITEMRQQHPGLVVVLTGGDAPRFQRALENGIFAHPFLTLLGLHALLEFDRPAISTIAAG